MMGTLLREYSKRSPVVIVLCQVLRRQDLQRVGIGIRRHRALLVQVRSLTRLGSSPIRCDCEVFYGLLDGIAPVTCNCRGDFPGLPFAASTSCLLRGKTGNCLNETCCVWANLNSFHDIFATPCDFGCQPEMFVKSSLDSVLGLHVCYLDGCTGDY
jgi:hypothetical protein